MRVLAIAADRSKRGVLFPNSAGYIRQEAYAKVLGQLDIIGYSLESDNAQPIVTPGLTVTPTNSTSKFSWILDARRLGRRMPHPDVVTAQDPFEAGLVAYALARYFKKPLHIQVHTDFLSPEFARQSLLNRLRVQLARFVLSHASRVRVVSPRIESTIRENYGLSVPITVLPIYADLSQIQRVIEPSLATKFSQYASRLLVVSRLEPEKNITLAVKAFAPAAPMSACLIIVGDGSEKAKLEEQVRMLGLFDRVFFEGEREATRYYALADLVLVPSKYEGYGLTIVEALAAGKPVLSTDVGIAREAGAVVTTERNFTVSLSEWFKNGPKTGELRTRPYENFDGYVKAYCDDIALCMHPKE